jgi:subtilisin family serine protease
VNARLLATPWANNTRAYSAPGHLILKLALGEAPDYIPTSDDVRAGALAAADRLDGGPIDRILRHFGGQPRIMRVHSAAAAYGRRGRQHKGFDDLEHTVGLSRIFRVDTEPTAHIGNLIDSLRQLSYVESVSPYYLCAVPFGAPVIRALQVEPAIDLDEAWQPRDQVRASEAMAYEPGDAAIIVALVDTGIVAEHTELRDRSRAGYDAVDLGLRDLAAGMQLMGDLSGMDTDPADEVGHGTSCAGIIGARGECIPPGLAGASPMLPIRVLGSAQAPGRVEPIGVGALANIDNGMKRAIELGAKVINMSFGTAESALMPNDPRPHQEIVQYALARGCILIAASGNSGREERFYPAAHDGVIAVGSTNAEGQSSSFSTSGDHVALAAPGERVLSTGLTGYQRVTGTSFAAPFVSATAALLAARAAARSYPLDSPHTRQILCEAAQPWRDAQLRGHGAGILDAHAALRALDRHIDRDVDEGLHMNGAPGVEGGP